MKNFERFVINSEKLLNNEELLNLKGGNKESTSWKCFVNCDGYQTVWYYESLKCEWGDFLCAVDECNTFHHECPNPEPCQCVTQD